MSPDARVRDAVKRALAAKGHRWSIEPPKGWEHESEDTLDTFLDPDGVGALQISSATTTQDGGVTDADLIEAIEHVKLTQKARTPVRHGAFTGYSVLDDSDPQLRAGPVLLFVTYICAQEDIGREARAVKQALDSLRLE